MAQGYCIRASAPSTITTILRLSDLGGERELPATIRRGVEGSTRGRRNASGRTANSRRGTSPAPDRPRGDLDRMKTPRAFKGRKARASGISPAHVPSVIEAAADVAPTQGFGELIQPYDCTLPKRQSRSEIAYHEVLSPLPLA